MKKINLIGYIAIPAITCSAILPLASCGDDSKQFTVSVTSNDAKVSFKGSVNVKVKVDTLWDNVETPEIVLPSDALPLGWYNQTENKFFTDMPGYKITGNISVSYVVYSARTKSTVSIVASQNADTPTPPQFETLTYPTLKGVTWGQFYDYWQPKLPTDENWKFSGLRHSITSEQVKSDDVITRDIETAYVTWDYIGPEINCTLRGAHFTNGTTEKSFKIEKGKTWWDALQVIDTTTIQPDQSHTLADGQWINTATGQDLPTDEAEAKKVIIDESFNVVFMAPGTAYDRKLVVNYTTEAGTVVKYRYTCNENWTLNDALNFMGIAPAPQYYNYNFLGWYRSTDPEEADPLDRTIKMSVLIPDPSTELTIESRTEAKLFCTLDWATFAKLINSEGRGLTPIEEEQYKQLVLEKYQPEEGKASWIGMERTIYLQQNDTDKIEYKVKVIGENHDKDELPDGKTLKLTFMTSNVVSNKDKEGLATVWSDSDSGNFEYDALHQSLNTTDNNTTWYRFNSETRSYEQDKRYNKTILSMLKDGTPELYNNIKPVEKNKLYWNSRAWIENYTMEHQKLFIPSVFELTGKSYGNVKKGTWDYYYQYYKTNPPSAGSLCMRDLSGRSVRYWTRTPYCTNEHQDAIIIDWSGTEPTNINPTRERANNITISVVFGFCI